MPNRQLISIALLACFLAPLSFTQTNQKFEQTCVEACLLNPPEDPADIPATCDCQALELAMANSNGASMGLLPNGLLTASDLVYEAKAQYDARMADVEDYYFVEQSFVTVPSGFAMPGFFQTPSVVATMPQVRFFMGELGPDGERRFAEVAPADLARMQAENQEGNAAAIAGDPAATLGAFAEAYQAIADNMPDTAAGGLVGGLAEMMSGKFREVQAGVAGQQNSEDGFGGNGSSDGFGAQLEKEMTQRFLADPDALKAYVGIWRPNNNSYSLILWGGSYEESCVSLACGADQSVERQRINAALAYVDQHSIDANPHYLTFVLRIDEPDGVSDVVWEGRTYRISSAELWLYAIHGENWVPVGRRFEYLRSTLNGVERIVIEGNTENYEPAGPMLVPRKITQRISRPEIEADVMEVKKLISRIRTNEGPPSPTRIADLIREAMQDTSYDPLMDEDIFPTSNASPPNPQPEPSLDPATGQTPLIIPEQGLPAVQDEIPVLNRPNN